ncbi:SDR family oxidoreductase (plasmid) [Pedobacter sp. BS3]|uniref:SDR family NAD(P)-dependent oxidoreductase n=1 Tax=Pedobacter sp. BS3 TaxID=2567937 RepID=UPI0011F02BFD|nr:SDR family NAD(P)-dependent oxidoreductase [Pedobacter sp. BS3]TZF85632.1 SDR family oxidoreductase [Pedobacter sp. BS3]
MYQKRYQEQIIIVTGGAEGLGKSLAARYLLEGAEVVLFDRNEAALKQTVAELREKGLNSVSYIPVDISDQKAVEEAFDHFDNRHATLDVMVNCAGIVGPSNVKITEVDVADFDKVYQVNLRGSFLMAKYAIIRMKKKNYGRILLVASIAGKEGNSGMVCYSASKSGVIGLVKSLGKEFAQTNITINSIAPGVIRTALVDAMPEPQVKYMTDKIPMQRCGTLEEFASLASWITSPEASFNTGFVFDLSGGRATY